jgi:hypothetical protein
MALMWNTDPHSEVFDGNGSTTRVDFIESAKNGNRTYRIAAGDRWLVAMFVVLHLVTYADFDSEAEAKAQAEQWEAERIGRYAEGCNYAKLKGVDASTEKGFGDLWADKYNSEGLTIAQAWEDYKSG